MMIDLVKAKIVADFQHADPADGRDAAAEVLASLVSVALTLSGNVERLAGPEAIGTVTGLGATLAGLMTSIQLLAVALYGKETANELVKRLEEQVWTDQLSGS